MCLSCTHAFSHSYSRTLSYWYTLTQCVDLALMHSVILQSHTVILVYLDIVCWSCAYALVILQSHTVILVYLDIVCWSCAYAFSHITITHYHTSIPWYSVLIIHSCIHSYSRTLSYWYTLTQCVDLVLMHSVIITVTLSYWYTLTQCGDHVLMHSVIITVTQYLY